MGTILSQLEAAIHPATLALLRRAGAVAAARGERLALVGGPVRDLLLARPMTDLDLLVEGDAIALAQVLAAEFGAAVQSYGQFGTATVVLPEETQRQETGDKRQETGEVQSTSRVSGLGSRVSGLGSPGLLPIHTFDIVTARTEVYPQPAALPIVTPATLRADLARRDFTINTLAIGLNPSDYGVLYDFYAGQPDLAQQIIRVLHDQSFIDDPTRMLRAVRLAARLGFSIEPHSATLLAAALAQGMLARTTPQRLINELRLLLHEPLPERAMGLLAAHGLLTALHPALSWSERLAAQFGAARQAAFGDAELSDIYLGLIVYPLNDAARAELIQHYRPATAQRRLLHEVGQVQAQLAALGPQPAASVIDQALHGLSAAALRVAQLAAAAPGPHRIARYLAELRPTTTELDGEFLRQLGLPAGPIYRQLLAGLRAARLDGLVNSRADEEAWLRRAIQ